MIMRQLANLPNFPPVFIKYKILCETKIALESPTFAQYNSFLIIKMLTKVVPLH